MRLFCLSNQHHFLFVIKHDQNCEILKKYRQQKSSKHPPQTKVLPISKDLEYQAFQVQLISLLASTQTHQIARNISILCTVVETFRCYKPISSLCSLYLHYPSIPRGYF